MIKIKLKINLLFNDQYIYMWVGIPLSWGTVTIGGVVVNGEAANKIQVLQLSYKVVAWIQLNGYNESC